MRSARRTLRAERGEPRTASRRGAPARFVIAGLRQARRRGAELLQRHRPDVPLRRGRHDRRPAPAEQRRVLRPRRQRGGPAAVGAHRPGWPTASICGCGPKASAARWSLAGQHPAYYDTLGRTWERQALIKVRPVAGDLDLGRSSSRSRAVRLPQIPSFAEINGIKALKRQIEQRAEREGGDDRESRPATAASATSSSRSSSCNCSTAATCPKSAAEHAAGHAALEEAAA